MINEYIKLIIYLKYDFDITFKEIMLHIGVWFKAKPEK